MNIFNDTAKFDEIREAKELGVLDGVTTNPSLIVRKISDVIVNWVAFFTWRIFCLIAGNSFVIIAFILCIIKKVQ